MISPCFWQLHASPANTRIRLNNYVAELTGCNAPLARIYYSYRCHRKIWAIQNMSRSTTV
jgi:hypothetical protein